MLIRGHYRKDPTGKVSYVSPYTSAQMPAAPSVGSGGSTSKKPPNPFSAAPRASTFYREDTLSHLLDLAHGIAEDPEELAVSSDKDAGIFPGSSPGGSAGWEGQTTVLASWKASALLARGWTGDPSRLGGGVLLPGDTEDIGPSAQAMMAALRTVQVSSMPQGTTTGDVTNALEEAVGRIVVVTKSPSFSELPNQTRVAFLQQPTPPPADIDPHDETPPLDEPIDPGQVELPDPNDIDLEDDDEPPTPMVDARAQQQQKTVSARIDARKAVDKVRGDMRPWYKRIWPLNLFKQAAAGGHNRLQHGRVGRYRGGEFVPKWMQEGNADANIPADGGPDPTSFLDPETKRWLVQRKRDEASAEAHIALDSLDPVEGTERRFQQGVDVEGPQQIGSQRDERTKHRRKKKG